MPRIRLRTLNLLAKVSLFFIAGIVVTGAAVRLSGSGLGCSDWPRCNADRFVDVSTHHGRIEQVNRLFTGVVAVAVILAMLGAQRLREPNRRLRLLGAMLVLGVVGQIVLGGIVVLTGLNPFANLGHFALSMFLVATNVGMVVESGQRRMVSVPRSIVRLGNSLMALTCGLLLAGMVVTGSGPHAGDEEAKRFGLSVEGTSRIHSVLAWFTLAMVAFFIYRVRRAGAWSEWFEQRTQMILYVLVAQGAVGYWQYFTDVPAGLVGVHVALATILFITVVRLWWECRLFAVSCTN